MSEKQNYVSLKDIRTTFLQLRDFEISNLWQRSIFLSASLIVFFSAYGFLVSELIKNPNNNSLIKNEVCCGIALCGFAFSIIWIMMAKGSKAWYEVYEVRINEIEIEEELDIPKEYRMSELPELDKLDSNLFTNIAGKYSVSKLNIMIGIFLMFIWFIILVIHYVLAIVEFNHSMQNCVMHTIVFTLTPLFFLTILITALCNTWAKSNALKSKKIIISKQ